MEFPTDPSPEQPREPIEEPSPPAFASGPEYVEPTTLPITDRLATESVPESAAEMSPQTEPERLDSLLRAEDLDVDRVREWIDWHSEHGGAQGELQVGSAYSELALATTDDSEAEHAFQQADAIYTSLMDAFPPTAHIWLEANRGQAQLPVMRMRRAGFSEAAIAPVAHATVIRSLSSVLSAIRSTEGEVADSYRGKLAEDTIPGLFVRTGMVPYLSSWREGSSNRQGVRGLSSDFHIFDEHGKAPVEVKYDKSAGSGGSYDRTKVLFIRYLPDVCRPLIAEMFSGSGGQPTVQRLAMRIPELLVREEYSNEPLHDGEQRLLDRASELVGDKLYRWRAGQK